MVIGANEKGMSDDDNDDDNDGSNVNKICAQKTVINQLIILTIIGNRNSEKMLLIILKIQAIYYNKDVRAMYA